jgi:hypothetical protein
MSRARTWIVAIGLLTGSAISLRAQTVTPPRNACLDGIAPSAMRRVPVFVSPRLADSTGLGALLLERLDLLTHNVAQVAQTLLGADGAKLPAGEPRIGWRSLEADLHLVSHHDGRTTWRVDSLSGPDDVRLDDAGALLLAQALDSLLARGDRLGFPESFRRDSVVWHLVLRPGLVDSAGTASLPKLRFGAPAFMVVMPPWRHVRAERVRVQYPDAVRKRGHTGRVVMDFVVDTLGRAIPATIREVRSTGEAKSTASAQGVHERLLADETRRAIEAGRFVPAMIAGCVVRERVRQPFDFRLYDGRHSP